MGGTCQAMAVNKTKTEPCTSHMTWNPLYTCTRGLPAMCEKKFSALFVPQPMENHTSLLTVHLTDISPTWWPSVYILNGNQHIYVHDGVTLLALIYVFSMLNEPNESKFIIAWCKFAATRHFYLIYRVIFVWQDMNLMEQLDLIKFRCCHMKITLTIR